MINVNELKEFLGCDEKFLSHLMVKFIEESGDGVKRLKAAAEAGNWPVVKGVAHKMLSSTRIFSINELSDKLEEIEIMADAVKDTDQIPGKVAAVDTAWKGVVDEINALLPTLTP